MTPLASALETEITIWYSRKSKLSKARGMKMASKRCERLAKGIFCRKLVLTLKTLAH